MNVEVDGVILQLPDDTPAEQVQAMMDRVRVANRESALRAPGRALEKAYPEATQTVRQFASGANEMIGTVLDAPSRFGNWVGQRLGLSPGDERAVAPATARLTEAGMISEPVPGYEIARSAGRGALAGATLGPVPAIVGGIGGAYGEHYGGAGGQALGEAVGGEYGGKVGRKVGETVGGFAGGVAPTIAARGPEIAVERLIGRHRAPDAARIAAAAEREGVTPTGGMLGGQELKTREKQYLGRGGTAAETTRGARERTLVQLRERADAIARARGAQGGQVTPEMVGSDLAETSGRAAVDLERRIGEMQDALMDSIGRQSDVDITDVLTAMQGIRGRTDPQSFAPVQARVDNLIAMLPRDAQGNITSTMVPYERFKDWRSNLGRRTETMEGVSGRNLDTIYGPATDAMRATAVAAGVPADVFDRIQGETRRLLQAGGPVSALERTAATRSPAAEAGRMERDPEALLRLTESRAPDVAEASDRIAGNALSSRTQSTLDVDRASNTRDFANWWQRLPEESRLALGGPEAARMDDIATLARAYDYPTQGGGFSLSTGRTAGNLGRQGAGALVGGAVGRQIDTLFGLPGVATGAGVLAGRAVPGLVDAGMARLLQSDMARRSLAGQPAQALTVDELLAHLARTGAQ